MEENISVIKVENLTKDYGHGRGVFDFSFYVKKGEVFGFLGPNGAGKSTTIRHIMGFSRPQKGQTSVFELESFAHYNIILKDVGYLPGEIALPEGLSGWEFIDMMSKLRGIKNQQRLNYLLKKFDFNPIGETKKMSLGDKRKLAIVVAFMNDPEVLILDEPTSGLDPVMQQVFIDFIKEEKSRGKTILLSSHIFNEVEETCDRIAIIKDGKIVSLFKSSSLKHNKNKAFEIKFNSVRGLDGFCKLIENNFNINKKINKSPKLLKNKEEINKTNNENSNFDMSEFLEIANNNKNSLDIEIKTVNKNNLTVVVAVHDDYINNLIELLSDYKINEFCEIKLTLEDYFMKFYENDHVFGGV